MMRGFFRIASVCAAGAVRSVEMNRGDLAGAAVNVVQLCMGIRGTGYPLRCGPKREVRLLLGSRQPGVPDLQQIEICGIQFYSYFAPRQTSRAPFHPPGCANCVIGTS